MSGRVSMEEYWHYRNELVGFCTACQDWTRECTEPDAREYDCPVCEELTVFGTEEAMLMGLLEVG